MNVFAYFAPLPRSGELPLAKLTVWVVLSSLVQVTVPPFAMVTSPGLKAKPLIVTLALFDGWPVGCADGCVVGAGVVFDTHPLRHITATIAKIRIPYPALMIPSTKSSILY